LNLFCLWISGHQFGYNLVHVFSYHADFVPAIGPALAGDPLELLDFFNAPTIGWISVLKRRELRLIHESASVE